MEAGVCPVCTCVCVWLGVQTKRLWNIWMLVIALLTRVTSQINQTWWGDCRVFVCLCTRRVLRVDPRPGRHGADV